MELDDARRLLQTFLLKLLCEYNEKERGRKRERGKDAIIGIARMLDHSDRLKIYEKIYYIYWK